MNHKDINFVELYRLQGREKKESNTPGKIYLAVFLIATLLLGALTVKLLLDQQILQENVSKLETYINNSQRQSQMTEITKLQRDVDNLNTMEAELADLNNILAQIPRFDRQVLNVVTLNKTDDIEIMSVNYDGEWLTVSTRSEFLTSMSNYALKLEESGKFEDVLYTGYSADSGFYNGEIRLGLKGNEVATDE